MKATRLSFALLLTLKASRLPLRANPGMTGFTSNTYACFIVCPKLSILSIKSMRK
jgi:hypothetical protein